MVVSRFDPHHALHVSPLHLLESSGSSASHKSLSPPDLSSSNASALLVESSNANGPTGSTIEGVAPTVLQQSTFTIEEVSQLIQHTVRSLQRDQFRPQHTQGAGSQGDVKQGCQVLKPRIHVYEHHPHSDPQIAHCSSRTVTTILELPGLTKTDIEITARPNGDLIVTGERKSLHPHISDKQKDDTAEFNGRLLYNELKFGRFQRILRLPKGTDVNAYLFSMWSQDVVTYYLPIADLYNRLNG